MVVLVDSNRAVKITIREWDEENTQYRPDWSADFFEVGSLQQVPDLSDCTDADLAELGLPPRAVIQLDDVVEPSGRIIDGIGTFNNDDDGFMVRDVDYCIEQANDMVAGVGDFAGDPQPNQFDAAGRHYDGGKESVDRFWNDLKTDRGLSVEPRYVELAFGCPPIEWDIDARVRDFAERMGDEYTSLYEQDTTGIKGGDFERFGAFADNRLDFIRALTKARGMDPISSDREIGAFLNTFDKLAAMPEPTPAKQEKDELSAGACDPADPLNLEQSSSYGMTR